MSKFLQLISLITLVLMTQLAYGDCGKVNICAQNFTSSSGTLIVPDSAGNNVSGTAPANMASPVYSYVNNPSSFTVSFSPSSGNTVSSTITCTSSMTHCDCSPGSYFTVNNAGNQPANSNTIYITSSEYRSNNVTSYSFSVCNASQLNQGNCFKLQEGNGCNN